MLDHDISARAARRLLSSAAPVDDLVGPDGWTRRRFLQAVGLGVVGGAAIGSLGESVLPGEVAEVFAGTPVGPTDGIVVNVMLYGGNDGLNTVVPYTDGNYYTQRGAVSIPPTAVLPISPTLGLHPNLAYTKSLYDAGQVAIVQGVGYPVPDLSHFTSMAIWMNGRFSGVPTSGWLGRWLDGQSAAVAELAVAAIDSSVPLHLVGDVRRAVAVSPFGDMFGSGTSATDQRMYTGVRAMSAAPAGRGPWHDMFAATLRTQLDVARDVAPVFVDRLSSSGLVRKMTIAARLINANVGLRVLDVSLDGFDDHDTQLGPHAALLGEFDAALRAFYETLLPQWRDQVILITQSEFGRTPWSNESGGTDHGTASDLFVIGTKVRGGLHGQRPSLAGLRRWDRMAHHVDFRAVFGTVIDGWLGGGGSTVVNGSFAPLGLFASGPAGVASPIPGTVTAPPPATVVLPPAASSGFTSITPTRVLDTRDGTGGRATPLGPQEAWKFVMAGRAGVPTDAVAVAFNLTAVDASASTFVTAHPFGEARPLASNLNPVPGRASPNLVVSRLGIDGAVVLFNSTGTVHLVADVVGFFTPSSAVGLVALDPSRLLDTRDGTGNRFGALGAGESIAVDVAGLGGVPADAQAVALNVTATEPSELSYLTVWPAGEERPLASSVNMAPGQTVPNLVFARLGEAGRVSIYNNSGSSHVVVDVLGAFVPGATARFVPVSPSRALDTRDGVGGPRARITSTQRTLGLTGRCGVPASGVSAVLLNVTAVSPTTGTYVTVFPTGRPRPLASNLNATAGQVVPNMVLARLGPDGGTALYNNTGDVDLVADVMGYFTG